MGIGVNILLAEHQSLSRLGLNDKSDMASRLAGGYNETTEADTPGMNEL